MTSALQSGYKRRHNPVCRLMVAEPADSGQLHPLRRGGEIPSAAGTAADDLDHLLSAAGDGVDGRARLVGGTPSAQLMAMPGSRRAEKTLNPRRLS
jgi:hypothetical protein